MAEISRAQYLLQVIEAMDIENAPEYSLNRATGYTFQDRGKKDDPMQYPTGRSRPSGLQSPAGHSA